MCRENALKEQTHTGERASPVFRGLLNGPTQTTRKHARKHLPQGQEGRSRRSCDSKLEDPAVERAEPKHTAGTFGGTASRAQGSLVGLGA